MIIKRTTAIGTAYIVAIILTLAIGFLIINNK